MLYDRQIPREQRKALDTIIDPLIASIGEHGAGPALRVLAYALDRIGIQVGVRVPAFAKDATQRVPVNAGDVPDLRLTQQDADRLAELFSQIHVTATIIDKIGEQAPARPVSQGFLP